jgi:hypothetical protein
MSHLGKRRFRYNCFSLTKAEGRRQEAVFVTGIYTPLQKLFALKGEVLDPIVLITRIAFLDKSMPFW